MNYSGCQITWAKFCKVSSLVSSCRHVLGRAWEVALTCKVVLGALGPRAQTRSPAAGGPAWGQTGPRALVALSPEEGKSQGGGRLGFLVLFPRKTWLAKASPSGSGWTISLIL